MKGYPDSDSLLENTSVIFDDTEPAAQALVNRAPSPLSWQVPAHSSTAVWWRTRIGDLWAPHAHLLVIKNHLVFLREKRNICSRKTGQWSSNLFLSPRTQLDHYWNFLGSPVVNNYASTKWGMGSVPGWATKIPHALGCDQNVK